MSFTEQVVILPILFNYTRYISRIGTSLYYIKLIFLRQYEYKIKVLLDLKSDNFL